MMYEDFRICLLYFSIAVVSSVENSGDRVKVWRGAFELRFQLLRNRMPLLVCDLEPASDSCSAWMLANVDC